MSQRPPRSRRNRLDGEMVTQSFKIPLPLKEAVEAIAREEFRNNKSAVIEQALIEFFNRRKDVRAA
jgi:predicted transcriptional regulator